MKQRQREQNVVEIGEFSRKFVRQKMRRQACHIQLSTKLRVWGSTWVCMCVCVSVYMCV